jgi:hypothetical protein
MSSLPSGWNQVFSEEGMILTELESLEHNQQTVLLKYENREKEINVDVMAERTKKPDKYAVKEGVEYYVRKHDSGPVQYDYEPDNFEEAKQSALDWIEEIEEGMTEEEIKEAEKKAYEMGRRQAPDTLEPDQTPDDAYESMRRNLPQMSTWANSIEPDLRRIAGYKDPGGMGTYTEPGTDQAPYVLDELVDIFWEGVYDELHGKEARY